MHCREANRAWQEGQMGKWIVHVVIAAPEALPIIGQIVSLFEALIVNTFIKNKKQPSLLSPATKPVNPPRGNKPEISSGATDPESSVLPHGRPKRILQLLSDSDIPACRKPLQVAQVYPSDPGKEIFMATNVTFYPFNSEGVKDEGWGCAWRGIQTILSSYGIESGFKEIFSIGGPLKNLRYLYGEKYPEKDLPLVNERGFSFSPYETDTSWAEPFIGEMVLEAYKIDSELLSLYALPAYHYAPEQVFHQAPLNFSSFKQKLISHFQQEEAAPVMIDDGMYAFTIVGVQVFLNNQIGLFIADPHIDGQRGESRQGLYTIRLDEEGKNVVSASARLSFDKKPWMMLFPKPLKKEAGLEGVLPNQVFQIFVKHVNGKYYTLDVNSNTTIGEIEEKLVRVSKHPVLRAKIVFAGRAHEKNTTLGQMNAQKKSTLYVNLRIGG